MGDMQEKNWCEDFFDDFFAEHHLVRTDKTELDKTVSFLEEQLRLQPGQTVFDQCCGVGSLSAALASKGCAVTGVDLIPSYVERARRAAPSCRFEAGDAHAYVTPEPCDAAINWWTSFGYTPDDEKNMEMLRCIHQSLKPGGRFALDYMNAPQRLREFGNGAYARSETKKGGCTSVWESRLDRQSRMIVKTWRYRCADGKEVVRQGGGAKLYTQEDLKKMFHACGFSNLRFYGSVAGEALTDASPRCIVVAEKEA